MGKYDGVSGSLMPTKFPEEACSDLHRGLVFYKSTDWGYVPIKQY